MYNGYIFVAPLKMCVTLELFIIIIIMCIHMFNKVAKQTFISRLMYGEKGGKILCCTQALVNLECV